MKLECPTLFTDWLKFVALILAALVMIAFVAALVIEILQQIERLCK